MTNKTISAEKQDQVYFYLKIQTVNNCILNFFAYVVINQSINLYFRHMAHKKQRKQTENIYKRYTYIKPSSENALKMIVALCECTLFSFLYFMYDYITTI